MKIAPSKCPTPHVGDITICVYCADVLEFGPNLYLIKFDISTLTPEEQSDIIKMQNVVRQYKDGKSL